MSARQTNTVITKFGALGSILATQQIGNSHSVEIRNLYNVTSKQMGQS